MNSLPAIVQDLQFGFQLGFPDGFADQEDIGAIVFDDKNPVAGSLRAPRGV
jgi:hypothetical protein